MESFREYLIREHGYDTKLFGVYDEVVRSKIASDIEAGNLEEALAMADEFQMHNQTHPVLESFGIICKKDSVEDHVWILYTLAKIFYKSLGYNFEYFEDGPKDKKAIISKEDQERLVAVGKTERVLVFILRDMTESDPELASILKNR